MSNPTSIEKGNELEEPLKMVFGKNFFGKLLRAFEIFQLLLMTFTAIGIGFVLLMIVRALIKGGIEGVRNYFNCETTTFRGYHHLIK